MYARFFTKVHERARASLGFREPFARLFNQGMIHRHRREDVEVEGQHRLARRATRSATARTRCGSTSLFMGPADQDMEWQDTGVEGV